MRHPPPPPPQHHRGSVASRARLALALLATFAACEDPRADLRQPLERRDANAIVVGALGDLGGADGARRAALEAELERWNARGGAKGRAVRLLCYDDQGRPEGVARALERLVREDKVVALCVLSGVERADAARRDPGRVPMLAWSAPGVDDPPHARDLGDVDAARCAAELVAWLSRARTYDKQDLVDAIDGPPPLVDYSIKPPPSPARPAAAPSTQKAP